MGEVLKNHKSFVKIIISLKYFLFMVVDQHLCDIQNLVQISPGISEEMWLQAHTHTHMLFYMYKPLRWLELRGLRTIRVRKVGIKFTYTISSILVAYQRFLDLLRTVCSHSFGCCLRRNWKYIYYTNITAQYN